MLLSQHLDLMGFFAGIYNGELYKIKSELPHVEHDVEHSEHVSLWHLQVGRGTFHSYPKDIIALDVLWRVYILILLVQVFPSAKKKELWWVLA